MSYFVDRVVQIHRYRREMQFDLVEMLVDEDGYRDDDLDVDIL